VTLNLSSRSGRESTAAETRSVLVDEHRRRLEADAEGHKFTREHLQKISPAVDARDRSLERNPLLRDGNLGAAQVYIDEIELAARRKRHRQRSVGPVARELENRWPELVAVVPEEPVGVGCRGIG